MLKNKLPLYFDPFAFCPSGQDIGVTCHNEVLLSELVGLKDLVLLSEVLLQLTCSFQRDRDNIVSLSGQIEGKISLICQRCLQPFSYSVSSSFLLSPVTSDSAAKQLSASYEPIMLEEGKISLNDFVTTEVILALPLVPKHTENCLEGVIEQSQLAEKLLSEDGNLEKNRADNPFSVLEALK